MKTAIVTNVVIKKVLKGANAGGNIVVFSVQGGRDIVRSPKEALMDMHNSLRARTVPEKAFEYGFDSAAPAIKFDFREALDDVIGATLVGDFKDVNPGDKYLVPAGHKDVKAGLAKEGDTREIKEAGVYVDGFLKFPRTKEEKEMKLYITEKVAREIPLQVPAYVATSTPSANDDDDNIDDLPKVTQAEAFGTTKGTK